MTTAELKTAAAKLKYFWSSGYDHEVVLGPKSVEMKDQIITVCDAYLRLSELMPDVYEVVVQAKAHMYADTKKAERASAMLQELFTRIRGLPECQR